MDQLTLPPDLHQPLEDLADATGRTVEDVVVEAVRRYLVDEECGVLKVAQQLGQAHAELLRRLGE
ncbi:hypothetical protein [Streptomyces acidiscabies]|uniref:Ribbon-helix-helix protein CopG domain-containing protein n=1 Tax=Streptomyces acidiscabies TaxID=42234 RepID=A0AAP6EDZ1_9ACTN|nr:hypothetical protein [Streptomyces acidiscabies]MBP5939316.1 hypothetical protein [Streptomyces sp. LBUM 1476]MBZ3910449.1 hypothetical protein [Streptomyces acidiscabies]MDX2959447.1 hypothetical protein [Streptomyces acidiscabies]MDX3019265.1 hypothetical protein [Streptomyces acidiscabies]MDX3790654.1 hypothetical protein [Streptomyces acidiscabies]